MKATQVHSVTSGVPNLDSIVGGSVPAYSLNIVAGPPGTGKTILVQQIIFSYVRDNPGVKALYLTTLSEPTVKVVRHMQHFFKVVSHPVEKEVLKIAEEGMEDYFSQLKE